MQKYFNKEISINTPAIKKNILIAWCFYDWASVAFSTIITTFIFATYFTKKIAINPIVGTYQWANAAAIAGIIIAIASPLFGAIADHGGRIKRWLAVFLSLCILSSALLWFALPQQNYIFFTLGCFIAGTIGLEVASVFYNSFLPHIAPKKYIGRISGWGWGLGYVGGIIALSIALFGFVQNAPSWLNADTSENIRICGPFTAAWLFIFSLPLFLIVPDTAATGLTLRQAIQKGMSEIIRTLRSLPTQKNIFIYLIAHMIYVDGLNTLFAFGGIYAAGTFGMDLSRVILFGITMNISAGIGAIALSWVDDYLGSKKTILISLFFMTVISIPILFVKQASTFWIFALLLCLFVGPVQAASRSLLARLVPIEKTTEMFGLYAFSGRATSFIGPWLLGFVTLYFQSQRAGIATILLFFILGGLLLSFVRDKLSP